MALDMQQELIRQVETMSMGQMTVRFTNKGQPSYFHRIRKFSLEDIHPTMFGSGTHPAFIVGGSEVDEILIGIHQCAEVDGEGILAPGYTPKVRITRDGAVSLMRASGAGFCVVTNAMRAAVALLAWKDQQYPLGNTDYGRSHADLSQYGLRPDGNPAVGGNVNGNGIVRTGSGPISWNYPRNPFGIQGLVGNVWEWAHGLQLNVGEILVIENNDAALGGIDLTFGSSEWMAIDRTDGSLVAPGSSDTVFFATSGTADGSLVATAANEGVFASLTPYGVSTAALEKLRGLAIMPPTENAPSDKMWLNLSGGRALMFGGGWKTVGAVELWGPRLDNIANTSLADVGFRPAYVEP